MPIRELTLDRWKDLGSLDQPARIYRGQSDADWPLASSLERCIQRNAVPLDKIRGFEDLMFREFRRGYHQYAAVTPDIDWRMEWTSIMQHHGAPTRLLDFTYSIYVAAYFAFEASSGDAAIWAIDAQWAVRASLGALSRAGRDAEVKALPERGSEAEESAISELVFGEPVRMAWPLTPFRLNERLRTQRGIFLAPGDTGAPFMEKLKALAGHGDDDHVLKINLPAAMRSEALRELFHMNITRTSLFPGLDGYAASLGVYHPTVFNPIPWRALP